MAGNTVHPEIVTKSGYMKKWNTHQRIVVSGVSLILVYIIVRLISGAIHTAAVSRMVREYLSNEIQRAESLLSTNQFNALMVGVGEDHQITVFPCTVPASFHYPTSLEELETTTQLHFNLTNHLLKPQPLPIPGLKKFDNIRIENVDRPTGFPFDLVGRPDMARIIKILRNSFGALDPTLTIIGCEASFSSFLEVHAFHLAGPPMPSPELPVSDVPVLSRLCAHALGLPWDSQNWYKRIRDRLYFEDGSVVVIDLAGATDETIDLLRDVPNLAKLLANLRTIDLKYASISSRSLNFLKKELPHVETLIRE